MLLLLVAILFLELFDATLGVNVFLLACIERMAAGTDFHFDLVDSGPGLESVATSTSYSTLHIFGVNAFLHECLRRTDCSMITPGVSMDSGVVEEWPGIAYNPFQE